MSSDTAITVRDLSKCYLIYARPQDRLKQSIFRNRQYFREFWALKDVSFDIRKGETVGIIGRNGSGKSTLLQIIAGILSPTSGEVEVSGRVAALLELGSGFNPEFTGRENVFMNGAILGISREDMEHRFDEIAAFADIGEFIEQPVKTYSSGMIVRLAFSVAINVNADILIVDEALSVGDMRFQAKCIERIKLFQKKGGTILLVSHNLVMIRTTCTGCIWIEDSKIREMGPVDAITSNYEFYVMRSENNAPESNSYCDNNGDVIISGVNILNSEGNKTEKFTTGDDVRLLIELNNRLNYPKDISLGVAIHKENGLELSRINTSRDDCKYFLNPGENTIELCLFSIDLLTGSYYISIFVGESNMRYTISKHEFVASFYIETPFSLMGMRLYDGLFRFKHNWLIK